MRAILKSQRGSAALVAVSMFVLLGIGALAVDLGMLMKVRAEAQRAADAAALAGASAFMQETGIAAVPQAHARALDYAGRNTLEDAPVNVSNPVINGLLALAPEVTVQVIPDSVKVRVWVHRSGIGIWFARVLGFSRMQIGASAAAVASPAGQSKCVKPFAIPDLWSETSTGPTSTQDTNADKVWSTGERWEYQPPADTYAPWDGTNNAVNGTGYGSSHRDLTPDGSGAVYTADKGRVITLKAQRPTESITSSFFYPWRMPMVDPETGEESLASGANDYRALLEDINCEITGDVDLSQTYSVENGNMVGPTRFGVDSLISADPGARWDPTTETVVGIDPKYGHWTNSPRVVSLALFDPAQIANIQGGGGLNITFNNIALFFIEGFDETAPGPASQRPVKGRFLYFAAGSGTGPVTGPLFRVLQLVE